ncbi:geranylgeranyl transferase type-1 subunit beta-like isoform X1 [Acropora millepora]|uniref:geranylgeranyl transferase type-1 subunit beta-like isoform X1 n=1 Tax=Acropora millepora TaxID=45264 RepID=UPI001CF3069A|nr:geranylgeranyl transferase type-1 subunit beta-like isoform X1 [Acropora millepora]
MEGEENSEEVNEDFICKKHAKFFRRSLDVLPSVYSSLDTSRVTVAFFALSGLDILNSLHLVEPNKKEIIEWIYHNQKLPATSDDEALLRCGFRGSSTTASDKSFKGICDYDCSHIAMTYTALASLLILGDDLSRVDKVAVIKGLKALQLPDGSFQPTVDGSENDMRFIYCACCISYILNDWSGIDVPKVVQYIKKSRSYDSGFGQGPCLEAHGGSTFCALASLVLMDCLDSSFATKELEQVKRWCLFRQMSGFQGRPNKPVDTCYSFWVGASLKLLGSFCSVDFLSNRDYLISTQASVTGGFSKWPGHTPDALHTYFGLCGLSLMKEPGLREIHAALNITQRAADHLHQLHEKDANR